MTITSDILGWFTCPSNLRLARQQSLADSIELGRRDGEIVALRRLLGASESHIEELQKIIEQMKVPQPQYVRDFTSNEIRAVLNAQEKQASTFDWIPWDDVYPVCSWQDWGIFTQHDDTQAFKYDAKRFDCNRFACVYFGRALASGRSLLLMWGITENYGIGHMWNYQLGFDHTLTEPILERRHFEPQLDLVWRPWEKSWLLFRAYG